MPSAGRPWWQQATALVSLGAGGAITGFSFVPRPAADLTSPSSMPIGLMALEKSAQPAQAENDALRAAIINVANYYLRMAQTKSPAEMEAIIWQRDSLDGVDHGESCAAFASLTLELGANVVGQQSWVTGGSTYPWPLHKWADARVNPNPGSPGVTSIVQDAQAHQRWHPVGDGYQPQPGDWVVFDGHVEVVTKYAGGVLDTIGGDSVPNFSVNAHQYSGPLSGQGVLGLVDNGDLPTTTADAAPASAAPAAGLGQPGLEPMAIPGTVAANAPSQQKTSTAADAVIPGTADAPAPAAATAHTPGKPGRSRPPGQAARRPAQQARGPISHRPQLRNGARSPATAKAGVAGTELPGAGGWSQAAMADTAAIPGLPIIAHRLGAHPAAPVVSPYRRHSPPPTAGPGQGTSAQQAFISALAPAAVAGQRKYGVPASVTIAQAIDESGWGQSNLAVDQHNLFGIKGTGPAGSYQELTQEYENGQLVTSMSSFRAYRNAAQSVDDHGKLLATSGYYRRAMAVRGNPNAFAASLTGVYATDPDYGAKLIRLMQRYDLYRYDGMPSAGAASTATPGPSRPAGSAADPGQPAATPAATPAGQGSTQAGSATGAPAASGAPAQGAWIPGTTIPGTGPGGSLPVASVPGGAGGAAGTSPPAARKSPGTRGGAASGSGEGARSQAAGAPAQRGRAAQAGPSRPGGAPAAPPAPGSSPRRTSAGGRLAQGAAPGQWSGSGTPTATRPAPGTGSGRGTGSGMPRAARTPQGAGTAGRQAAGASTARRPAAAQPQQSAPASGSASIPGVASPGPGMPAQAGRPAASRPSAPRQAGHTDASAREPEGAPSTNAVSARLLAAEVTSRPPRPAARPAAARAEKYRPQIPQTVRNSYVTRAKDPLLQAEPLYRDVAEHSGVRWQLLAACDWMQCRAGAKYSPVHGEKLGAVSADGTSYRTKSEALEQCAEELAALAWSVYGIDLAARRYLSVRDLANVFAAFRWGGLLRRHRTSAMEFPYSVAGLTGQHLKMRWPNIDDPRAPDKPGGRFRMPFGAVPVVLFLNYPATV
jgi:Mannosyl-glycoprotein endo-beta-N-acetylglucosaminidase